MTRRQQHLLPELARGGFAVEKENRAAVRGARIVVLAVQPQQLVGLLEEIRPELAPKKHLVISIVSGARTTAILARIKKDVPVVRAMPNTAIAIRESMTCLASDGAPAEALETARSLFDAVGRTLVITEDLMIPRRPCAPAASRSSCARSAPPRRIEIGFHSDDALLMARRPPRARPRCCSKPSTTPEPQIDKVTTPRLRSRA